MTDKNGDTYQPQLFQSIVNNGELPSVTPVEKMVVAGEDQDYGSRIAAAGDRRSMRGRDLVASTVLTDDMGLDRPLTGPAFIPSSSALELPGKDGRRSDHSRPLTRSEMLRGMSEDGRRYQAEINAFGADSVREIMRESDDAASIDPRLVDPLTGRARIGARASHIPLASLLSGADTNEGVEEIASPDFVRGVRSVINDPRKDQIG